MKTVGAYEAKTHFASLLDDVQRGHRVAITRNGHRVAILGPSPQDARTSRQEAVAAIRRFRKGQTTGGESLRSMIEEGRRF